MNLSVKTGELLLLRRKEVFLMREKPLSFVVQILFLIPLFQK